jgi:hypothetical protein
MNIPLQLKCPSCGALRAQRVHLNNPSLDFTCEKCGSTCYGVSGLDVTVGVLILVRSRHELEIEKDYDMGIVLAATAFECELSWLYCKWRGIEAMGANAALSPEDCEKELRAMGSVADKITKVSGMLYQGGIEKFVADSASWSGTVNGKRPSLHIGWLAKDFQQTVFWLRNKVLHQGQANHTREDAAKCCSIAELGIRILKAMDNERRMALERGIRSRTT